MHITNHEGDFDDLPTDPALRAAARPRVLLVEDDESLRELIAARMRGEAFEVVEAANGREALDLLLGVDQRDSHHELDLLVMDVHIPGLSGFQIARSVRESAWPMPIILITAFPDARLLAEASRLGINVLAKPFPLERLSAAAIQALVTRSESA